MKMFWRREQESLSQKRLLTFMADHHLHIYQAHSWPSLYSCRAVDGRDDETEKLYRMDLEYCEEEATVSPSWLMWGLRAEPRVLGECRSSRTL